MRDRGEAGGMTGNSKADRFKGQGTVLGSEGQGGAKWSKLCGHHSEPFITISAFQYPHNSL